MAAPSLGVAQNFEKVGLIQEKGYVAWQVTMSQQVTQKRGGRRGTYGFAASNAGSVSFTKEFNKISNLANIGVASKFKPDWNKVCDAVKKRSFSGFVAALLPGLEFTAKGKSGFRFPFGVLHVQGGVDFKHLPILIRGFYTPKTPGRVTTRTIISINAGPSIKGWAYIAQKVGAEALKNFLFNNTTVFFRTVYTTLMANGVFLGVAAASITLSFGLFTLTALYAGHRARKGELTGLATWYVSAYQRTLYGESITALKAQGFRGDRVLRDKLIKAGEVDVVKDAKNYLQKNKIKLDNPNDDMEALGRFGSALAKNFKTSTSEATKQALYDSLMKKAKQVLSS